MLLCDTADSPSRVHQLDDPHLGLLSLVNCGALSTLPVPQRLSIASEATPWLIGEPTMHNQHTSTTEHCTHKERNHTDLKATRRLAAAGHFWTESKIRPYGNGQTDHTPKASVQWLSVCSTNAHRPRAVQRIRSARLPVHVVQCFAIHYLRALLNFICTDNVDLASGEHSKSPFPAFLVAVAKHQFGGFSH